RDQYHDFIDGHGFRRTLLCHGDVQLNRHIEADCIARFHLASSAAPGEREIDPASSDMVEFESERGDTLATDHPLTKAALLHLGEIWPAASSFGELIENAGTRVGMRIDDSGAGSRHLAIMTEALFQAVFAGHVELQKDPPMLTTRISRKPQASLLARKQAEREPVITNLRHKMLRIRDEA